MSSSLAPIIFDFAAKTHEIPESILNSEGWGWEGYVGIRYGFLHLALELRRLAATLGEERSHQGMPITRAQGILAQHQAAFRDFQALLIGIDQMTLDHRPAFEEWPIRRIVTHVHNAERYFYAHILNALDNDNPQPLNEEQMNAILGGTPPVTTEGAVSALWTSYEAFHQQLVENLQRLNQSELQILSPMWEPEAQTIEFRMLRAAAHLREHTNQLEKSLWWLGKRPNETKLLLRQLYAALAEAEGAQIGASLIGNTLCEATATGLQQRIQAILAAVQQAEAFVKAIELGDADAVKQALTFNKGWARSEMPDRLSVLSYSKYQGRTNIIDLLQGALSELSFFEAAMVGNLDELNAWLHYQPEVLNSTSRDGFTALQLAAFFAHLELVQRLLDAGADVNAVSQNSMRIQPLHAAVAARHLEIVQLLIAAGADVNATQQDDFTPLMGAIQNKDEAIKEALRKAGAV